MKPENTGNWYDKYATKKTFSNGLMDGALLATSAGQLRSLLSNGYDKSDPKWYISISLVTTSVFCQVFMLILCAILANNNLADKAKSNYLNVLNNIVLVMTGAIFCFNIIVNVFVQVDFPSSLPNGTKKLEPFMPDFWSSTVNNKYQPVSYENFLFLD